MADESLEVLTKLIIIYLTTGTTNIALAVPFIANNVQAKYSTGTASFIIFSRVCFHIVPIFLRQYSYKNYKLTKTNDMLIDILWTMQWHFKYTQAIRQVIEKLKNCQSGPHSGIHDSLICANRNTNDQNSAGAFLSRLIYGWLHYKCSPWF